MKKPIIYAISGVIIVGVIAGGYFAFSGGNKDETTTAATTVTETASAVTENSTATTAKQTTENAKTTEAASETTTETTKKAEKTTAEDKYAYIRSGVYYIYDDSKNACYVLKFKKDGKVNVTQFDESNIVYEDPQYFKGFTEYSMDGNTVVIPKMPETVLVDSLKLTAKDGELYYGKTKLEKHGDVKLKYAAEHFNK